jgi:AraC-like DNA-binding protein
MDAPNEPLARCPALRTADPDEAQKVVSGVYVPHRLRTSGLLDARLNLAESARLTFGYLSYGNEIELSVPPMVDCYHLNLTVRGHTSVRHGVATTITNAGLSGVLLSPFEESRLGWSADAAQFAVKIPVRSMRAQLSSLLQEPVEAPRFDLCVDLSSDTGQGLLGAARFLAEQLDSGGTADLVREQLESYLLTQLLLGVEHSYSRGLHRGYATDHLAVGEAVDYIEAYPERPLGIAELAAVTGISAAALQAAFTAELGVRAETYVRDVRLARAHAQLCEPGPGDSLAAIARRWGFTSTRRFCAEYRARYGCSPQATASACPGGRVRMARGG